MYIDMYIVNMLYKCNVMYMHTYLFMWIRACFYIYIHFMYIHMYIHSTRALILIFYCLFRNTRNVSPPKTGLHKKTNTYVQTHVYENARVHSRAYIHTYIRTYIHKSSRWCEERNNRELRYSTPTTKTTTTKAATAKSSVEKKTMAAAGTRQIRCKRQK